MSKPPKAFDAVAMMRAVSNRLSEEIEGMALEQELRWLASQDIADPHLRRLRDRAARVGAAASRPAGTG